MKLFNVPIESLEERYSKQWNENFPQEFVKRKIDCQDIYPTINFPKTHKIKVGQFLDAIDTNQFKAYQIAEICSHIRAGNVKDGDVFFFHDIWFPGIEALFYIRDTTGIKFKICGMLHAGTYDPWDYLTQCNLTRWAKKFEECIFNEIDLIFVATAFHKKLLLTKRSIAKHSKVKVTGFPLWDKEDWNIINKRNYVVFPHRLSPEKGPEDFDQLSWEFRAERDRNEMTFVKTKNECSTKAEYYYLLKRSKIALSFAKQETWGIAQQEAMFRGCIPLVPNRLSYPELYNRLFIYKDKPELRRKLRTFMYEYSDIVGGQEFKSNIITLQERNAKAVDTMLDTIKYYFLSDQT